MFKKTLCLSLLLSFEAFSQTSFAPIVKEVLPTVVNISSAIQAQSSTADVEDSLVFDTTGHTALGSGFIADEDGYILTNRHVIEKSTEIKVKTFDGEEYIATLVGEDEVTDIALLKIEPEQPLSPAVLADSDTLEVGDWVLIVGNPFGLENTVSAGIISAKSRNIDETPFDDYIQTDAPINEGNSGGAMFNTKGQVVGLNTLIFSKTGNSLGVGFAIPSNQVKRVYTSLRDKGKITHSSLAMDFKETELENHQKALIVTGLKNEDWALKNDLRVGDIIISYNNTPVTTSQAFQVFISELEPSTELTFKIYRDGEMTELLVETTTLKTPHHNQPSEEKNVAD